MRMIVPPMKTTGALPTEMPSTTTPRPAAAQLFIAPLWPSSALGERYRGFSQHLGQDRVPCRTSELAVEIEHDPVREHGLQKMSNVGRQNELATLVGRPCLRDAVQGDCGSGARAQSNIRVL